ncbi:hypothetical protein [Psychroserpens sp.]|uniref:hypothetical protein n=1 Tax=Psychroserpens sp. TaxID=2020870 RepID=UPI002B26E9C4|nr:hypothetical protein [Psychroserpens sp.]
MRRYYFLVFTVLIILISGCGSDDNIVEDCTKIIVSEPQQVVTNASGTTVIPEVTQEVPCDYEEGIPIIGTNVNPLENFTYEVLYFTFIPDTGNNTRRIEFEIQLNNSNDFIAEGKPITTIEANGEISAGPFFINNAIEPCFSIDANSTCIFAFEIEEPLDVILNSISLIDVDYWLTTE